MKYQPLIDLKLIPIEIFPEKRFLPKSMPFVIYEINPFVKALSNMIDYMKEDEKAKIICRKSTNSLSRSISQISAVDIRKYIVTDPQRMNNNSLPFSFRILNQDEQIFQQPAPANANLFSSIIENNQFNENDLVLFKQHFSSASFPLELKNCIHQLAIEQKLESPEIHQILIRLIHNELSDKDVPKIIRNLQKTASSNRKESSLSNLMKTLLRIDQLEKFNKLDQEKVRIFNERINHL